MDNASKALIMAGAILIALVIVSVGVSLLSTPRDTVSQAQQQLDAQQILALNSQLSAYEGTRVKGSQVKALIDTIEVINARGTFPEEIDYTEIDLADNKYYEVSFADNSGNDGVYDECTIEPVS